MKTIGNYHLVVWIIIFNLLGWLIGITLYRPAAEASADCVADNLQLFGQSAQRPHRVNPGAITTFVAQVTNPFDTPQTARLDINLPHTNWLYGLSEADENFQAITSPSYPLMVEIDASSTKNVVITLSPDTTIPVDTIVVAQIGLRYDGVLSGCVQTKAMVSDQPKIYFFSIDGLSPDYLALSRDGERNPTSEEQLTPNLNQFIQQAAWFPDARVSLPAATDPNVYAFYSGSWPGTSGLPTVGYYFFGWDENSNPISSYIWNDAIRYGATGLPVLNIFDVAQDPAFGGDPVTFTALISGKTQVDFLFRTGESTNLDLLTDGNRRTNYMTEPQPYLLGDPPTDENAATDRDGVNIQPIQLYHYYPTGFGLDGDEPLQNPPDDWLAQMALRMIAVEDPDVMAVHFGSVDKIHHAAGSADVPEEWIDPNTPDILWDDINIFSRNANREPLLDVVYDADFRLGLIMDFLTAREVMDKSIFAIGSDHSEVVTMNDQIDLNAILAEAELDTAVRRYATWQEYGGLFLWDLADSAAIEALLESYTMYHRVKGTMVHPFLVISREEMDSGVDSVFGRFARDGGEKRGEMYSEWLIDYPVDDNSKVVWPDLFVFPMYHLQLTRSRPDMLENVVGGHSSITTWNALMVLKSPDFLQGTFYPYDASIVDVIPTVYEAMGWTPPDNVDGHSLLQLLNNR